MGTWATSAAKIAAGAFLHLPGQSGAHTCAVVASDAQTFQLLGRCPDAFTSGLQVWIDLGFL